MTKKMVFSEIRSPSNGKMPNVPAMADKAMLIFFRNALKTIFDTVFLQIEKLVSDQLSQITAKGLTAKAIFLVGGFGESRYLYNRLKACHRGDGISVLGVTSAYVRSSFVYLILDSIKI
jgi:hypothetical protein